MKLEEFDMQRENERIEKLEKQVAELWQERDHQGAENRNLWKKLTELELKISEAVR